MRVDRLQLQSYRNFRALDLRLSPGTSIFVGDNAQGKSNLLEAIYLLATMRGLRAETDVQMIGQYALDDVLPAGRIVGDVHTADGPLKLEVTLLARPGNQGPVAGKTVKVNGVARRLSDAVGRLTAVLFTAEDLAIVAGPPSERRRFLDIALSQVDAQYASARSRFERVLTQRNSLLKRIREREAGVDELAFWDQELSREGGVLLQRRARALGEISRFAAEAHQAIAPEQALEIAYRPRLDMECGDIVALAEDEVTAAYSEALRRSVSRDVAAGMTLQGPHRDDVALELDGAAASAFGSRAQQRTIALALRLAEMRLLRERRGEPPLLLLDDVLSEMDAGRRESVLASIGNSDQVLITGTDWDRFPAALRGGARTYEIVSGTVLPLASEVSLQRIADS